MGRIGVAVRAQRGTTECQLGGPERDVCLAAEERAHSRLTQPDEWDAGPSWTDGDVCAADTAPASRFFRCQLTYSVVENQPDHAAARYDVGSLQPVLVQHVAEHSGQAVSLRGCTFGRVRVHQHYFFALIPERSARGR